MTKKHKIIIVTLLILVILSAGAFAARVIFLDHSADKSVTTVAPDNLISENPKVPAQGNSKDGNKDEAPASAVMADNPSGSIRNAAAIKLYKGKASDNEKFSVANMLPGDSETKYFAVKVNHRKNVEVFFNAEVTEQTKALSEVLHIRVTHLENEKVLYNGTFANLNKDGYSEIFAASESAENDAYYKIEVSLPTSVENEYQTASLLADFNWFVEDADALDFPKTGDTGNIMLWLIIMLCSLAIIILLFSKLRKKEN